MRINRMILPMVGLCFGFTANATDVAMPTLYGFLNKEIRYVDQKDATRVPGVVITDVDGFESRFGLMGEIPWEDHKFLYKLEVGLNTNTDSAATTTTEDRIRVRLAQGTIQTASWGSFTFGQAWLPAAAWMLKFDPLTGTGLENFSTDTSFVGGSTTGLRGLGYSMKFFSDQLSYASPAYQGFQFVVTQDQRAQQSNFAGKAKQVTYEYMLTWDNGTDKDWKVRAMATHEDEFYSAQNREINTGAVMANYEKYGLQLSLGNEKNNNKSVDYRRYFYGFTWNACENTTVVATYGVLDKGMNPGFERQLAVGFKYMITPKVRWTVLYGNYVVDGEGTNIIDTDNDAANAVDSDTNTAHIITTGLKLDF